MLEDYQKKEQVTGHKWGVNLENPGLFPTDILPVGMMSWKVRKLSGMSVSHFLPAGLSNWNSCQEYGIYEHVKQYKQLKMEV